MQQEEAPEIRAGVTEGQPAVRELGLGASGGADRGQG